MRIKNKVVTSNMCPICPVLSKHLVTSKKRCSSSNDFKIVILESCFGSQNSKSIWCIISLYGRTSEF